MKILDFGLARAMSTESGDSTSGSNSYQPTLTQALTGAATYGSDTSSAGSFPVALVAFMIVYVAATTWIQVGRDWTAMFLVNAAAEPGTHHFFDRLNAPEFHHGL